MHIRNALHRSTYFCIWSVFHFLLHYSSFTSNFGSKVDNENLHIRSVRLVSGLERYNNIGQYQKVRNQCGLRVSGFFLVCIKFKWNVSSSVWDLFLLNVVIAKLLRYTHILQHKQADHESEIIGKVQIQITGRDGMGIFNIPIPSRPVI